MKEHLRDVKKFPPLLTLFSYLNEKTILSFYAFKSISRNGVMAPSEALPTWADSSCVEK